MDSCHLFFNLGWGEVDIECDATKAIYTVANKEVTNLVGGSIILCSMFSIAPLLWLSVV
ncbi:hypothetical protein LINPERHAP1_LOCUS8349, partial [Linum perenne]